MLSITWFSSLFARAGLQSNQPKPVQTDLILQYSCLIQRRPKLVIWTELTLISSSNSHKRRSSVNFWGAQNILPENMYARYAMPEFYMMAYLPENTFSPENVQGAPKK